MNPQPCSFMLNSSNVLGLKPRISVQRVTLASELKHALNSFVQPLGHWPTREHLRQWLPRGRALLLPHLEQHSCPAAKPSRSQAPLQCSKCSQEPRIGVQRATNNWTFSFHTIRLAIGSSGNFWTSCTRNFPCVGKRLSNSIWLF